MNEATRSLTRANCDCALLYRDCDTYYQFHPGGGWGTDPHQHRSQEPIGKMVMIRISTLMSRPSSVAPVTSLRGFTLIELMVSVSVLAILAALAAPAMAGFIASQRIRAMATNLNLALVKARSEAVKQNTSVTLSPLSTSWASGWQILDPTAPTTNPALDTWSAKGTVAVTTSPSGLTQVVFNANGRVAATTSISFVFTASATNDARCVSVDTSGRPYSKVGSSC